ncbi:Multidrug resistance protein A [Rhodovulum sp. P5]|uniref:HlyD family secretion protein n=1 Tax=Rhodovulum sp. P5 TaxID=1564506 RepID=UPI0009C398A4|nr:HlyD family secretion protein [Rhodovulum sp. P5]ARE41208.1 Multidrug resistance protein A [Rhodovulum sp. P5]
MNGDPGQFEADPTQSAPIQAEPRHAEDTDRQARARRWQRRLLMMSLPVALVLGGGGIWLTGGRYVDTDNAYVHQPIVPVSADVAGRVVEVDVAENQAVKAGDPVFRIDPEPYQIAVDKAEAALAAARLQFGELQSAYQSAETQLAAAEDIRDVRKHEYDRQQALTGRGVTSSAALDEATLAWRQAENDVQVARQGVADAAAALGGNPGIAPEDFPAVREAQAELAAARRDLDKALVRAPVAGVIAQIESLNVGQYLAPGTATASVVEDGRTWIEANFKETQLGGIEVGQPVSVTVDAYPGVTLTGHVESIGPATGSQYALIPAQNATGNWVKVVQRLSVRIHVDTDTAHPLRDGMSVKVTVDTGTSRLDALL